MKTTTLPLNNSINRTSLRCSFLLIPFVLACFALSPQVRAICQEGCLTNSNTALGEDALLNLTGFNDTAIGFNALQNNIGFENTATGVLALFSNTIGNGNTANGAYALQSNTSGTENTAIGYDALVGNTTGHTNTATGSGALGSNATGNNNTATGSGALGLNATGHSNTAVGASALVFNATGNFNTATGYLALNRNQTGSGNIALGFKAGQNLTTGSENIDIGNFGRAGESNTIRIGRVETQTATFIAGISGITVVGDTVVVDSNGQLGTVASAARYKDEIKPMDKASEAILALKPVMFRYKKDLDPHGIPQFGLVAENVEKVNPDLVARDEQGKPYTVRYEAVNAMLLNEFLKAHRKLEEQEAIITQQQKQIAALTAGLQKVSAQFELSKSAPQTVLNNQ